MALLMCSLVLNIILLRAIYKLIGRTHKAEADSKMYKDDSEYWHRKYAVRKQEELAEAMKCDN